MTVCGECLLDVRRFHGIYAMKTEFLFSAFCLVNIWNVLSDILRFKNFNFQNKLTNSLIFAYTFF